jgi:hypothetical protein
MSDEQDRAEALDDDVIVDDEEAVAGAEDFSAGEDRYTEIAALDEEYPPDRPQGVEDPGRFEIEDDLAAREARRHVEEDD